MKWAYFFFITVGYFAGGILFSEILPKKLKGVDVAEVSDDHNPGTANAIKYGGLSMGLLCLALDLAKGYLPVHFAMQRLDPGNELFALVVAAPVFGHAFPMLAKFRGGKAIAAMFGVCIALLPLIPSGWVLIALYVFFSSVFVIKTNAYCSAVTMAVLILDVLCFRPITPASMGVVLAAVVVFIRHIPSMRRESCSIHPPLLIERGWKRWQAHKQTK